MFSSRRLVCALGFLLITCVASPALAGGGASPDGLAPLEDHWHLLQEFAPALSHNMQETLGQTWLTNSGASKVAHIQMLVLTSFILLFLGFLAFRRLRDPERALAPEAHLSPTVFFELTAGGIFGLMCKMMGREKAIDTFPVVGALMVVILIGNYLGLVPGFVSATDNLNTTIGLGVTVFFLTHYYGVKYNGMAYFKHFMGPLWWLAPLMLPIEIISHLVRPMSLALRLMGNMVGDHKVLGIFLGLGGGLLLVPLPVMCLGLLVCTVQALVFCLLTVVYFSMAVEDLSHH